MRSLYYEKPLLCAEKATVINIFITNIGGNLRSDVSKGDLVTRCIWQACSQNYSRMPETAQAQTIQDLWPSKYHKHNVW